MVKLGKNLRSVSIIGVGCTDFMQTLESEETKGLTEQELFAYAAKEAMDDAGINPKDIDYYIHGEALPQDASAYITPNAQVANWFGMKGKASFHHSEACCTGYIALDVAANLVASGKYDVVLTGCVEMATSMPIKGKPAHMRREMTTQDIMDFILPKVYDRAYAQSFGAAQIEVFDDFTSEYTRTYGLTDEQMDDVLCNLAINSRHSAVHTPKSLKSNKTEYADIAKNFGFDNVMDFMKSDFNPKMSEYMRVSGMESRCEGAAVAIVCATDIAKKFKEKPIEILGTGCCLLEGNTPHLEKKATEEATRQVYELTGLSGKDVDLLLTNDFILHSQLLAAEVTGYLPKGEGWKYILDGETSFEGSKPINTNGGRCHFGHAYGASGLADVYEAVKQMRGQAEGHQIKNTPKITLLRGFGGGQNVTATILKTLEEEK